MSSDEHERAERSDGEMHRAGPCPARMPLPDDWIDPVVEAYKPGIDQTLLVENLKRSVEARIRLLEDLQRTILELNRAGARKADR